MKKSVYLFVCAVLGALLLVVIEQAFSLLYFLLYNIDYARYGFNLSVAQVQLVDLAALIVAIAVGGIYGLWLGRHWYSYIYEGGREAALLPQPQSPSTIVKRTDTPTTIVKPRIRFTKARDFARNEPMGAWEVDDLMQKSQAPVPAAAPTVPVVSSITDNSSAKPALPKTKRKPNSASAKTATTKKRKSA